MSDRNEPWRRLTPKHEQALREAIRVYANRQAVSWGLGDEGRTMDEAMSIIAEIVGVTLRQSDTGAHQE